MLNEKIMVLDTETCGNVNKDNSIVFDCGFMVCDYFGNIYSKHSYVIKNTFCDMDLMNTAYYKDKMPMYKNDIANGTRQLVTLGQFAKIIRKVCKENHITKVYAFNVRFDIQALKDTTRYLTSSKYRYILPFNIEYHDIMILARELAKEITYKNFCKENDYLTKNGRTQVKTEVVARYLFDKNFSEVHMGLQDCEIEYKILLALLEKYGNADTRLYK